MTGASSAASSRTAPPRRMWATTSPRTRWSPWRVEVRAPRGVLCWACAGHVLGMRCGCGVGGCARTPHALVLARARRRLAQSLSLLLLRARLAALRHAHPTAVFGALASSDEVVKALNALPRAEAAASPHASPARADAHAPAITVTTLPVAPALSLTPQVVVAMMASAFLAGAACASAERAR